MKEEIKSCILGKFAIHGFSIYEDENGALIIRARGFEEIQPNAKAIIKETDSTFEVLEVHGPFGGRGKKQMLQQSIDTWAIQCKMQLGE